MKPKLIVMSGLQGSGKSSIAYKLSEKLKIPIISVDPIHSAILKAGIEDSFEVGLADYFVAEKLAEENLENGISIIIDASNYVREGQKIWEDLASRKNLKLVVIQCNLDEKIHKERIEKRVRNIYGINEVNWDDVKKRKEIMRKWAVEKLILDTSVEVNENIEKIISYISDKDYEN